MSSRARSSVIAIAAVAAVAGGTVAGIAGAAGSSTTTPSRLDDGRDLLPQAKISESEAIAAAQKAESGGLNEVDLEHANGRLVYNVDVGSHDVKVDASSGQVVSSGSDD
jgi:uncharacterized membrane protein YkoI